MENPRKPGSWWAPSTSHLTSEQATAIADVIINWSVLEVVLQDLLVALTQSPTALGQALTEDLGPDNRLKALKRLARTWIALLSSPSWVDSKNSDFIKALDDCQALATWIAMAKARRNQIAHWTWFR